MFTSYSADCPLCDSTNVDFYHEDKKRKYLQCNHCQLVFVPKSHHLSAEQEKAEYDKHENSLNDAGYLRFLSRMTVAMNDKLKAGSKGLDLGSGVAPVLANEMERLGHKMAIYDLYYHPAPDVLEQCYDFVTCTEVIEHIAEPNTFIQQTLSMLNANSYLGFMTKLVIDKDRFRNWHYKNDPTHICFYSKSTFEFIAQQHNLNLEFIGQDVILLQKIN